MTGKTPKIIPQTEFNSLDEFMHDSNNFFLYFLDDCWIGELYRTKDVFQRFQKSHLWFEQETTKMVVSDVRNNSLAKYNGSITKTETWEKLLEAYSLMSKLVYEGDRDTVRTDTRKADDWFLCR